MKQYGTNLQLKNFLKNELEVSVRRSYLLRSQQKKVVYTLRQVATDKVYYGVRSYSKRGVTHNVVVGGTKNNTKLYCSCGSFLYQGFAYRNYASAHIHTQSHMKSTELHTRTMPNE